MDPEFSTFTARLRRFISCTANESSQPLPAGRSNTQDLPAGEFDSLALQLFRLQFKYNAPYRRFCESRRKTPQSVIAWDEIPAIPTVAFKELELSCLAAQERTAVFHSSGTTAQRPSRHFHNALSLALYEASAWRWFRAHVFNDLPPGHATMRVLCLTPPSAQATHSSLALMFETIRRESAAADSLFVGRLEADGSWSLDLERTVRILRESRDSGQPIALLGTAFSFVALLDHLSETDLCLCLPTGSRLMETGGYKGRSRCLSKPELHDLITQRLGIPSSLLVGEYGMSELSSQAYDHVARTSGTSSMPQRILRFPPWARALVVSTETGSEVAEGETGLVRVFDLANVFSVMAIQTEDLGIRRASGFELIGRAALAEPRGCSLMAA